LSVRNDYAGAFSLYEESLAVARAAGESPVPALTNLADVALAAGELERAIEYSAQAAELASGPDAETVRAIAAFNTASALIQLGRSSEALPQLRTALDTVVRIDYPELVGWCLAATSAVAASLEPRDAAALLGAAESAVESAGASFGPAERRLCDWTLSLLEDRLRPRELDEAVHAGRGLGTGEAVSLARSYLDAG
jgi:tetratricopeptide (TPR) repeat protein